MAEKRRYQATIGHKTYTLVGAASEARFKAVETLMNRELAQLKRLSPGISDEDAAILLAFNALATQVQDQAGRAKER